MLRFLLAAAALMSAPAAFAQQANLQTPATSVEQPDPPLFYLSGGFAWSGEFGIELEAGVQLDLGEALRLRFSPANVSLFDGDIPDGFYWDGTGIGRDCRDADTGALAIEDECQLETDSEWRSVVEAQFRLAPEFYIGAGAAYLLQGDFKPEDGRVSEFLSFAWEDESGTSLELRGGREYVALQVRSLW